jgi:hypothetical protein
VIHGIPAVNIGLNTRIWSGIDGEDREITAEKPSPYRGSPLEGITGKPMLKSTLKDYRSLAFPPFFD